MPFPRRKPSRIPRWVWRPRFRVAPRPRVIRRIEYLFVTPVMMYAALVPAMFALGWLLETATKVAPWVSGLLPDFGKWMMWVVWLMLGARGLVVLSNFAGLGLGIWLLRRKLKRAAMAGFAVCRDCMHPLTHRRGLQRCPECGCEQDGMQTRVMWKFWWKVYRCSVWRRGRRGVGGVRQ